MIAKLTFELRPVECVLAADAQPLITADAPLAQHSGLLSVAHDLAPFKAALDVVLVGRARALPGAALSVGGLRKTVRRTTAELFPLATTHAIRAHRAGPTGRSWVKEAVPCEPWPKDADSRFFNVAPEDQRISSICGQDIVLSGLLDGAPRLVTRIPLVSPAVTIVLDVNATVVEPRMDTVAIDLESGRVMVTWRAQLGRLTSAARVELRFDPHAAPIVVGLPAAPGALAGAMSVPDRASGVMATLPLAGATVAGPLPFRDATPHPVPPPAEKVVHLDTGTKVLPAMRGARPDAPPPNVPTLASPPAPGPVPHGRVRFPDTVQQPPSLDSFVDEDSSEGARTLAAVRSPLELLWLDPTAAERARAAKLGTKNPNSGDAEGCPNRRLVLDVLGEATRPAALELQDTLLQRLLAELEPPIVAIAGELSVAYDEIQTLLIMRSIARAAASGDRALEEILDSIDKVADHASALPLESAAMLRARLDEALQKSGWMQPSQLQILVERTLGEQRAYQRRHVFGDWRVRASVDTGAPPAVIAYLPDAAAAQLPMHRVVTVCLLGVVRGIQDPKESCPVAVDVIAIARRVVAAEGVAR